MASKRTGANLGAALDQVENNRRSVHATPSSFEPDGVRAWLSDICAAFEVSPTHLAKLAKIAPSTINKFLNGSSINKNLSGSSMMSIASAMYDLHLANQDVEILGVDKTYNENEKYEMAQETMSQEVIVIGWVGRGLKQEAIGSNKSLMYKIKIPRYFGLDSVKLHAFELREEGNRIFRNGSIVIISGLASDDTTSYQNGQRILVFSRYTDGLFEGTIYEYTLDPKDNGWLIPTWKDADNRKTLFLGDSRRLKADGYGSAIIVASIQPEPEADIPA